MSKHDNYIMFKCQRDNCKGNIWSTNPNEIQHLIHLHRHNKLHCPRCDTPMQPARAWGTAAQLLTTPSEQQAEATA